MGPDREVRIKPVLFQWLKIPGNTREYLDLHRQVWAVEVPLSTGSRSGTGPCSITLVLLLLYDVINVLVLRTPYFGHYCLFHQAIDN